MRTLILLFVLVAFPVGLVRAQITVAGRVMNVETKERLPDVRVQMMSEYGIATSHQIESITDRNGRYALNDVPEGRWRFRATWGNEVKGGILMTPVIEVGDESLVFDFEFLMRVDPALLTHGTMIQVYPAQDDRSPLRLTGLVIDPFDLIPLEGVRIRLYVLSRNDEIDVEDRIYKEVRTDSGGRYEIADVEPGAYEVLVDANGYNNGFSFARTIQSGTVYNVIPLISDEKARWGEMNKPDSRGRIVDGNGDPVEGAYRQNRLQFSGQIRGYLTANGQPVAGATIRAQVSGRNWVNEHWIVESRQDGEYRIATVYSGTYDLVVNWNGETVTIPSVTVTNDLNTLNIDL